LLVTGSSGGVGSAAIQMASKRGEVIAATTRPDKVDYLKSLGATHVIVGQPEAMSRNALFKDHPIDVVLETVGEPYLNSSLRTLRPGGRLVLVGNVTNGKTSFGIGLPIINELEIIGGDSVTRQELLETFEYLDDWEIRPRIHRTYKLSEANEAQAELLAGNCCGRIVLATSSSNAKL